MKERILEELNKIEAESQVKIIYACESGSRAWGFPSSDSDYDVRFIYKHELDWYLSIAEKKDVLERPLADDIDMNGWDIRKALQLLRKANPPLLEWLSSPIVYKSGNSAVHQLVQLSKRSFLPESSCHHYSAMARNCVAKFGDSEHVSIKNYLYALRATLCCEWIVVKLTQPPMRIEQLMDDLLTDRKLRGYVDGLILRKSGETEKSVVERSRSFEAYLTAQIVDMLPRFPKNTDKVSIEIFDQTLKEIVSAE